MESSKHNQKERKLHHFPYILSMPRISGHHNLLYTRWMVYRSVIPPICLHSIWHFCCICFGGGVRGEKMLCSVRYTRVVYSQQ